MKHPIQKRSYTRAWAQGLALALLTSLAMTANAFANDAAEDTARTATFNAMSVDSRLQVGNVVGGDVVVDSVVHSVGVTLYRRSVCPAGKYCIQMVPAPFSLKLPVTDESSDSCGTREIQASVDRRGSGGDLEEIRVLDHSSERCEIARVHVTEVYLDTTAADGTETHSYFGAGALQQYQE